MSTADCLRCSRPQNSCEADNWVVVLGPTVCVSLGFLVKILDHMHAADDEMRRLISSDDNDANNEPDNGQHGGPSKQSSNGDDTVQLTQYEVAQTHRDDPEYRVYKRRFFGLAQLVLLNIIVSWDWLTFAAISRTAANFFDVPQSSINWLSTAFQFAFVVISPLVIWALNKGPKYSILIASFLVLFGNWFRYAATRATPPRFGVVMLSQILIGFSQPFVLVAPTRYSNLWFSDTGRVTATAVASLANPLGGALGQLIGPLWATDERQIPNMVLYTSILSTVATLPAPFIPKAPPTPPSSIAASKKLEFRPALRQLSRNVPFYLILVPFAVYVGFFNATSSLINQIFEPYGFSETDAGIAGGLLILVGLIAAAITSPIVDRTKQYVLTIKILVPCIAASYLALIFMPGTRSIPGPYVVCAILGATSFSLLPCALEYLVLITHPVAPEISSTICWVGGQLLGAIFTLIMNALRGGWNGEPDGALTRSLVFQAVIAAAAVPFVLFLRRSKVGGHIVPVMTAGS